MPKNWIGGDDLNGLKAALEEQSLSAVRGLHGSIVQAIRDSPKPIDLGPAEKLLALLRAHTRFTELCEAATAIIESGQTHPIVRRLLAQGQIDSGRLSEGIISLQLAATDIQQRLVGLKESDAPTCFHERLKLRREQAEVQGLLGRAHKQRYVDAGPTPGNPLTEECNRAAAYYEAAYRAARTENLWHGINYVALLDHQFRLLHPGSTARHERAEAVAVEILATIEYLESQGLTTVWDYGTKAEALLALGRFDEAHTALTAYVEHPQSDRFKLRSTRRQFVELWNLTDSDSPGERLLPLLTLASTEGPGPEEGLLEARFADAPFRGGPPGDQAAQCARRVARIGRELYRGIGTGFLFDGRLIWPKYEGPPLMLTNAHVCSDLTSELEQVPPSLPPEEITLIFLGPSTGRRRNVIVEYVEVVWSSPRHEFDATLLMLGVPWRAATEQYPLSRQPVVEGAVANIIGHPLGGDTWYSVEDNEVERVRETVFYYTSATEPGNSGSPVFNNAWELIGLHRASSESKKLNYGIRIERILEQARNDLSAKYDEYGPRLSES